MTDSPAPHPNPTDAPSSHRGAPAAKRPRALPVWRLRHVLDYIQAHLAEDLTLAELAGVAGFSRSHFKPLFKQATGMPVHRFVVERRIERARALLLEGGKSMAEIALQAGFSHPSHMARCMRRVLGLGPSQIAVRMPVAAPMPRQRPLRHLEGPAKHDGQTNAHRRIAAAGEPAALARVGR